MNDLVDFAAYAVLCACVAMIAMGGCIAIGGDTKLYVATIENPARFLAWAGWLGAVGGVAYRFIKD